MQAKQAFYQLSYVPSPSNMPYRDTELHWVQLNLYVTKLCPSLPSTCFSPFVAKNKPLHKNLINFSLCALWLKEPLVLTSCSVGTQCHSQLAWRSKWNILGSQKACSAPVMLRPAGLLSVFHFKRLLG